LSLVGNLPRSEFERRLSLLGHKHEEIVKLAKKKTLPLFDQLALLGIDRPTIYEEVSEINLEFQDQEEEIQYASREKNHHERSHRRQPPK
jgi:hypothetical protein